MPLGGIGFAAPLSTVVFAWLLAVWRAISRADIVLGRLEPCFFKSTPTTPGACSLHPLPPVASGCNILQKSTWKVDWVSVNRLAINSLDFSFS